MKITLIIMTIIAILLIMAAIESLIHGIKNDDDEGFTNQNCYFQFYICGLIGLAIMFSVSILNLFPIIINPLILSIVLIVILFALTQHYFIYSGDPNMIYACKDKWLPRTKSGKKLYRLYEGKVSVRLPWHEPGPEINMYQKERVEFSNLKLEMKGVVMSASGTAIITPLRSGIHNMLQVDVKEDKRIDKISKQILGAIKGALGDELIFENEDGSMRFSHAEDVMNDKSAFASYVEKNETLKTTCQKFGYSLEKVVISDIDDSEESSKAREQVAIAERLTDAINVHLVNAGLGRFDQHGEYTRTCQNDKVYQKAVDKARQTVLVSAKLAEMKYIVGEGLGDKVRIEESS